MRTRPLSLVSLAVMAAFLLPLRTDGDQVSCCNTTTSLAAQANAPVAGDEAFFKLPTGPASVMLLLDTSGSMSNFPQCGDYNFGDTGGLATCQWPNVPASTTTLNSTKTYAFNGTCTPYSDGTGLGLQWMEQVTPQITYADPGRTNALLSDCPPWGNGGPGCGTNFCSGNNCLFDPTAYYRYNDWSSSGAGPGGWWPHATRRELDANAATTSLPTAACVALDGNGNVVTDCSTGLPINLGSACTSCMSQHGYYFYNLSYLAKKTWGSGCSTTVNNTRVQALFKGTFLNANPPKFVTARQVVKNLAWMDPAAPSKLDQVRLGLSVLDSGGTSPRKAKLIVPLGPDKGHAYPPTQQGYQQARQYILSVLNYDPATYTDSSGNVTCNGSTITGGYFNPASGSTPLGSAVFNIGQYFTAVSPSLYTNTFGASGCGGGSCVTSEFAETSPGRVNAVWATTGGNTQCSICWACQNSSVVIVTDGSPNAEIGFPNLLQTWDTSVYSSPLNCNGSYAAETPVPSTDLTFKCTQPVDGLAAGVPRVGDWLHNNDLRYDSVMSGQQSLTIHTIGFGIEQYLDPPTNTKLNPAWQILQATANMAGGMFQSASDPTSLGNAVFNAVNQVIPKQNSFSAASTNALQTVQTAASQAFLTRFKPNQTITWEGHVYEGLLFNEFLNGCDPTKPPAQQPQVACGPKVVSADFDGTYDPATGNAICSQVFLVDLDCDQVVTDATTGDFVKKGSGGVPATFPWDAGQVLSDPTQPGYRSADENGGSPRNIFTWVNGAQVAVTAANAATLQPYMNIDSGWCNSLLTQLGITSTTPTLECAKQVIWFVRGWDVLDQDADGCAGPDNPKNASTCPSGTNGEERNRANDSSTGTKFFWKLGDVFHSSPGVLQAPTSEILCDIGYDKQCVATIHSPQGLPNQTPIDTISSGTIDAYQIYAGANATRKRVVLVGANDGMLHAFDAGDPNIGVTDATGSHPYSNGSGTELWAFVPPDLLPRLKDLLSAHQYMVDASVMVRDIWVDANGDGKKESSEFHTVAVVGRRAGGNQYSALDVTNPLAPTLLWSFPQACGDDARYMAESWSEFAPGPPPIGPVKIFNSSDPRGFSERWIVMFGGGYDPALDKGRAVFMVDAWTGQTLWRFTDDDFKSLYGYGSSTSMFPVPGGVGLVDIGDTTQPVLDVDGFFDTATWGDMGGNLWVARFQNPGVIDGTTGRVGNWYAARAFEEQRQASDQQFAAGRSEFFYMTANAFEPTTKTLRTFIGSGNREQIMAQTSICGADALFGCCQAGCTLVTGTTTDNYGACSSTNAFACTNGLLTRTAANNCAPPATCAAAPTNTFTSTVDLHFECPGAGTVPDAVGQVSCDGSGLCSVVPVGTKTVAGTFGNPPKSRFYGVWSYGGDPNKMFDALVPTAALAQAKAFDHDRFTDVPYAGTCTGPTAGTCTLVNTTGAQVTYSTSNPQLVGVTCAGGVSPCQAAQTDAGWFYEYGDVCSTEGGCPTAPPWYDEKTGSAATVVLGCTTWSSFRPYGMTTSTDPCSGNLGTPASSTYVANYVTGTQSASCGYQYSGVVYAATQQSTTAPPMQASPWVTRNPSGQISYSALQINAGASPTATSMGTRSSAAQPVYWLEVPRELHQCRHQDASSCE